MTPRKKQASADCMNTPCHVSHLCTSVINLQPCLRYPFGAMEISIVGCHPALVNIKLVHGVSEYYKHCELIGVQCLYQTKKMFGVFDGRTGRQPTALINPSVGRPLWYTDRRELAQFIVSVRNNADTTFYNFPNRNFMALSQKDEKPPQPRSIVVLDDLFCIFFGYFDNAAELQQYYGLSRKATEAMIVCAAYKVMRDRGPFPPDQAMRDFKGGYAFMLFDSKHSVVFLARDREGTVELHWGTALEGSLVICDDARLIPPICGNCYTPFPRGFIVVPLEKD